MYRLTSDFEHYYDIDIDIYAVEDAIDTQLGEDTFYNAALSNIELTSAWSDVGGTLNDTGLAKGARAPDISIWNGIYLILSAEAFGQLNPILADAGEFMPITLAGSTYQLFNCRRIVNVDENASETETINGEYLGLKSIRFESSAELTNTVCKTKFDNCSSLYCSENFKKKLENLKLYGLQFETLEQQ
ncbi:hypothetical protein [Marinagarivorans cellulosilyticus]|uniref:Uncharacterized protein n=1 Tax=Marinagarivorans cellulosilyticus TaxID=2721545 RepID=A0AAN1WHH2_9GAMM|nr:hypothetical protein [Marinagarivorans cellulosilyticus]BCD97693.1 hypothetical protein MARGE09_P1894 [Marinagarivorans cellulosilyticus]